MLHQERPVPRTTYWNYPLPVWLLPSSCRCNGEGHQLVKEYPGEGASRTRKERDIANRKYPDDIQGEMIEKKKKGRSNGFMYSDNITLNSSG
jgi:hypothetical protein